MRRFLFFHIVEFFITLTYRKYKSICWLFLLYFRKKLRNALQVEYVVVEKEQADAYKEAIEEYRAASQARIAKTSEVNSNSILGVLPRRQISNYFVQFRKVLLSQFIMFLVSQFFCSDYIYLVLIVVFFSFPRCLDCKSSFTSKAYLQ